MTMDGSMRLPRVALAAALAGLLASTPLQARTEALQQFVHGQSVQLEGLGWNGHLRFDQAFCGDFPHPQRAQTRGTALLNNNAVAMARTDYPDRHLYIVASTLPDGRSAQAEFAAQQALSQRWRDAYGAHVEASADAATGTVSRTLHNVLPDTGQSLFPLELAFTRAEQPVSVARSHVFVSGGSRIEVAALLAIGQGQDPAARLAEATADADALLDSVRRCSAGLPAARRADGR